MEPLKIYYDGYEIMIQHAGTNTFPIVSMRKMESNISKQQDVTLPKPQDITYPSDWYKTTPAWWENPPMWMYKTSYTTASPNQPTKTIEVSCDKKPYNGNMYSDEEENLKSAVISHLQYNRVD